MTTRKQPNGGPRLMREAHLRWVPIGMMKVSELAQRRDRQYRVDRLVNNMDPEKLGTPTVSHRDDHYYIVDGQHRVFAYAQWIGEGWEKQQLQCWTYEGLTEVEEADMFLVLNDTLTVSALEKYKVSVQAGREVQSDIDRVVRGQGLCVTGDKVEGGIRAVAALERVYKRDGSSVLARSLGMIRDAYGDSGLEAPVIDGMGLLCGRYNGQLDTPSAVQRLANANGGVHGLLNKAEQLRKQTGNPKAHCVAAAAVETVNQGKGRGAKLPSWWKSTNGDGPQ